MCGTRSRRIDHPWRHAKAPWWCWQANRSQKHRCYSSVMNHERSTITTIEIRDFSCVIRHTGALVFNKVLRPWRLGDANTYCTEITGLGLSRYCLGRTAASKHLYDCYLTVAGAISCYLRQTDLLHSFLILYAIGSPYFFSCQFLGVWLYSSTIS